MRSDFVLVVSIISAIYGNRHLKALESTHGIDGRSRLRLSGIIDN
jgi:hypothetical protein